ncbi:MAG: GNAT family N-acetyltransferase [Aureliella sp.]
MERIELSDDPASVRQHVSQLLSDAAHDAGHAFEPESLALEVVENEHVVGGLTGTTNWDWLYIEALAVDPEFQKQGLARELVSQAESIAISRGCVGSWVDTFTFQAPEFYLRLGYQQFGTLPRYPATESRIFLCKLFSAEKS